MHHVTYSRDTTVSFYACLPNHFSDRKVKHWSVIAPYVDWRKKCIDCVVSNSYKHFTDQDYCWRNGDGQTEYITPLIPFVGDRLHCLVHLLGIWIKTCLLWGRYSCDGPLLYNWRIYFYQYRGGQKSDLQLAARSTSTNPLT